MSLEWARARALGAEVRLRELLNSGGRGRWVDPGVKSAPPMSMWNAPASAGRLAPGRTRAQLAAKSVPDNGD